MTFVERAYIRLFAAICRKRIVRLVREDPIRNWPLVCRILSSSGVVYSGVTGPAGKWTIQAELMEVIISTGARGENLLWESLTSPDPVISGYCINGLQKLMSQRLGHIPEEVLRREELLTFRAGSFGMTLPVSEFARITIDNWKKRRGREKGSEAK